MDFLEKVAYKLFENHRDEMDKQVVVLPSRRAGLYLSGYLSRLSDRPQWAPQMVTVTDLFASFTSLKQASNETLIFDLYHIYKNHVTEPLSFDDFWSWGEIIINDYNDIDLWLADADKLYSNISDLKEIDDRFGSLDERQVEIIRKFWISFNPKSNDSAARNRFMSVWKLLGPLYSEFTAMLRLKGYAGVGMLCRDVAGKAETGRLELKEGTVYHIAGLNALNECEKKLFRYLKERGQARFYWDDSHSFMKDPDHKASVFINYNLKIFGNELENTNEPEKVYEKSRWTIIDTPSDTAQAKMLPQILLEAGIDNKKDLTDTAIVLADEKLLMPVLMSLPREIEEVNVTMGHPFRLTPLYSFIRQLFIISRSARRSGQKILLRTEDILVLLRHQYFRLLAGDAGALLASELISANMIRVDNQYLTSKLPVSDLFNIPAEGSEFPAYLMLVLERIEDATYSSTQKKEGLSVDREYLRLALAETGKLRNLINEHNLLLKTETCIRLIDRVFKRLIVPFSGEPLKGIQIMGVLETRALEFSNIIFLSLNEGIFPHQGYDNTFIPYNIRRAFGLPTINEHESIYSYHFFRLLRKPKHGWFLYNSTSQGLNTGEMSRYLIQMKYNPYYRPEQKSMNITVGRSRIIPETLGKEEIHIRFLLDKYSTGSAKADYLSPSAINTWMNCRMKFYYLYVCGLPEEEKLEKDIDQRRFGNILHDVMQKLYEPLIGESNINEKINKLSGANGNLRKTIIEIASREMKWSEENLLAGKGVIIVDVLERYIRDVIAFDRNISSLELISLEEKVAREFEFESAGEKIKIKIGGRVDRIDRADGFMRVVDYKTGSAKKEVETVEELFDESKDKRSDAALQTMLYCNIVSLTSPGEVIMPSVYWVQKISSPDFDPLTNLKELNGSNTDLNHWNDVMNRFADGLKLTLNNIFSRDECFVMTEYKNRCTPCPFRRLCRR